MSRRLEAMEARNGARLLQRTTSGYELTALGEAVLGNAERMEAEAIAVERMVQGRDVALSGVVRLTTVEVIANLLLPRAVVALQARYPAITLDVLTESRSLNLTKREADIAIRMTRFDSQDLITRRMGTAASALYASPGLSGDAWSGFERRQSCHHHRAGGSIASERGQMAGRNDASCPRGHAQQQSRWATGRGARRGGCGLPALLSGRP
jgi:DNA-binding transcriptional LysR family regulator